MLESLQNEELEYKKLSAEEQAKRGILGRLVGICADFISPTRNGRHYSEELWEKTFADPIMKERIENGVCYGELGHPADREETDMEKIAVCLPEVPKKNKDGKLTAVFDILDTPCGRILKSLCDYGSTLGISSRGSGDTYTDFDGNEEVDPDSYTCQGFDVVLIPAVKSARLKYVTESLNTNKKSLKESLQDTIDKASEEDKKVMEETLDNLGIDLKEAKFGGFSYKFGVHAHPQGRDIILGGSQTLEGAEKIAVEQADKLLENPWMTNKEKYDYLDTIYIADDEEEEIVDSSVFEDYIESVLEELSRDIDESFEDNQELDTVENSTSSLNIDEVSDDSAVVNDEAMFEELQNVLKKKNDLEQQVISLNEKLSVCYAKEEGTRAQISKLKAQITKLTESSNQNIALKSKVAKLEEDLNKKDSEIKELNKRINTNNTARKALSEDIDTKNKNISKLSEELTKTKATTEKEINDLNEEVANLKKDLQLSRNSYSKKLEKSNKLIEQYKKVTNHVINRYIDSQALKLGISSNEIKNKLPESYNIDDIDAICEDLQSYKLNMSKLPFSSMQLQENMKFQPKSMKQEAILPKGSADDFVDEQLLSLLDKK